MKIVIYMGYMTYEPIEGPDWSDPKCTYCADHLVSGRNVYYCKSPPTGCACCKWCAKTMAITMVFSKRFGGIHRDAFGLRGMPQD